jgi:protein-tyrosine-phosphatase
MAEALCKNLLATRLGCEVQELFERGYRVMSAGIFAYPGDGPAPDAVETVREMGADLSSHVSKLVHPTLVALADHILAMTQGHLTLLKAQHPFTMTEPRLLCGSEGDLGDPIGQGREVYRECARTITRHLERFLQEIV